MTKEEVFAARIGLLDEMLTEGFKQIFTRYEHVAQDRRLSSQEVGYTIAVQVFAEWKAIVNGQIAHESSMAMPRETHGIE
jgi:hypothetical protein